MARISVCIDCGGRIENNPRGVLRKRCPKHALAAKRNRNRLSRREWYKTHRAEELKRYREWYVAKRKHNRTWKAKNKRRAKAWRQRNKEHVRAYNMARYEASLNP